jgi:hypothetical protein
MARTRKTITTSIHGADGRGATLAEAKADAAQRIQRAFADDGQDNPQMLRFPRGEVVTVYRTLEGWTYGLLGPEETRKVSYGSGGGYPSRRDATMHALRHIAQDYWDDEASGYGHDLLHATDDQGHREQTRYGHFQREYQLLKAHGKTDAQCHDEACQAMSA